MDTFSAFKQKSWTTWKNINTIHMNITKAVAEVCLCLASNAICVGHSGDVAAPFSTIHPCHLHTIPNGILNHDNQIRILHLWYKCISDWTGIEMYIYIAASVCIFYIICICIHFVARRIARPFESDVSWHDSTRHCSQLAVMAEHRQLGNGWNGSFIWGLACNSIVDTKGQVDHLICWENILVW